VDAVPGGLEAPVDSADLEDQVATVGQAEAEADDGVAADGVRADRRVAGAEIAKPDELKMYERKPGIAPGFSVGSEVIR
jgi:hypothetical protein